MARVARQSLSRVSSRKEFMETLYDMNCPPRGRGRSSRGRFAGLKTYMLERNGDFGPGSGEKTSWDIGSTGVDSIKILTVRVGKECAPLQFYMDTSDRRFLLLHTNELAHEAGGAVEGLVGEDGHSLDHAWFHSGLMDGWAGGTRGELCGCVRGHGGRPSGGRDAPRAESRGPGAKWPRRPVGQTEGAGRIMPPGAIEVSRGERGAPEGHVRERISSAGYFAIKRGRSIQDHLRIVGDCKDEYAEMVAGVERCGMGASRRGGAWEFGGSPIEITYPEIPGLGQFVDALFSATRPFRLWGIKVARGNNRYSVPAVDLHGGGAINFEITPTLMRVYTRKGGCGNTILRLLTNLQAQYSACARCSELA